MSRKMMELLAVRYFGQGMYTESTFVYEKLQELYPEDPQACEWQGRIVINALATDNKRCSGPRPPSSASTGPSSRTATRSRPSSASAATRRSTR
jgi:hypothetical protein